MALHFSKSGFIALNLAWRTLCLNARTEFWRDN